MIMMRNISSNKVPAIKSLNAIIILTLLILNGVVHCNDSNNLNLSPLETPHQPHQQQQQPPQRRVAGSGGGQLEKQRSSYAVISQAFTDTVNNEFGSAHEHCEVDDLNCPSYADQAGLEAIKSLHRQLDDDDNGDIDLSESDDFLREELKYEGGYEKRHRAFHFNDDMHISVKELWEAWLKSEVHNWTVDQTCDWLIQSVQLPQYVNVFKKHNLNGRVLPRLAVNNFHFVGTVLGIKDPIHKQKISLKAMDAVLFGPPRETGTKWKDIVLVTLLLTAIIGTWYAYQQNKNAKGHLKRMARDMEQLHKAETELQRMQSELEKARVEQENVDKERMDLERRLKEAPSIKGSNSEAELQQLRQEIEMLRNELSRAEVELIDHHWQPPQGLQHWLQYTYELETRSHQKKRVMAETQLLMAREACEKLRKKRSSFVGAFVSTHGKSIDDVDRTIVDARNALGEVTHELQERLHRWKQIETMLGCNIVKNNGFNDLERLLYRSNGSSSSKTSKGGRMSASQDDLDDDSIQGFPIDAYKYLREREGSASGSEDDRDRESVTFVVGSYDDLPIVSSSVTSSSITTLTSTASTSTTMTPSVTTLRSSLSFPPQLIHQGNSVESNSNSNSNEETRSNISSSSERNLPPAPPRAKKPPVPFPPISPSLTSSQIAAIRSAPPVPPRRSNTTPNHTSANLSNSSSVSGYMESLGALSHLPTAKPLADITSINYKIPSIYRHYEDNISTDSSSFGDETKKRKRRLFGFGKKSNKSKVKNS